MLIERAWAMPSANTFTIKPIAALLDGLPLGDCVVDPFSRTSTRAHWSNDLSPATPAQFHMEAEEFADMLIERGVEASAVLLDPPYSSQQVKEVYQSVGIQFAADANRQAVRWPRLKDKLASILKPGGLAVSFGWSTTGFGKGRGFVLERCLLVNHAGAHNDTLCTVERKIAVEVAEGSELASVAP
jgi:hypothetical protein